MVPSDSIELTSEAIMLPWAFGTFTLHLLVSFIKGLMSADTGGGGRFSGTCNMVTVA